MKKIIFTFGIISGVVASVLMLANLNFMRDYNHGQRALAIGYTVIVLAGLLIYFGIRSYRDNVAGGVISYGRGFAIGIGIALVSSLIYVVVWEIVYFSYMHTFMDSYFTSQVVKVQAAGGTPEAIQAKIAAIRHSQQLYGNVFVNALYTFIEPFPVYLVLTLVSAAILRKKVGAPAAA